MLLTVGSSECEHCFGVFQKGRVLRLFQLQALETLRLRHAAEPSFYEKLNTRWHERALQGFMLIVLAHWGEHLVQAYQIYVMGWPRPKA